MKQTSTVWLKNQIDNIRTENLSTVIDDILLKAIKMNEEEIKDAYGDGLNPYRTDFCNRDEYFMKIYGKS